MNISVMFKVYNDADILEKIMKDRRRDLGPATDDDDMVSPKLKISMLLILTDLLHLLESNPNKCVNLLPTKQWEDWISLTHILFVCRKEQRYSKKIKVLNTFTAEAE